MTVAESRSMESNMLLVITITARARALGPEKIYFVLDYRTAGLVQKV